MGSGSGPTTVMAVIGSTSSVAMPAATVLGNAFGSSAW